LDEDYNILIDSKNLDLYSGWERDLANLCLRLSLGQNLTSTKWNPIHFLILDEVLASQDTQRQQNIFLNLKKLEKKFSQIILISHLEEMKDLAPHLIEIKAIDKDESTIYYYW
jgi:exonuclease SbcC